MKTFNDFESAYKWLGTVIEKVNIQAREDIAREVYKDSRKYTFYDTGKMYDSGKDSDFKGGYVVIKAPQVRRLYYTNWVKNPTNPNSRIQWFEVVKKENKNKYIKLYKDIFSKEKR